MPKSFSQLLLTLLAAFACAVPALADPWTPTGLNPGDRYRLVFVTSVTRDGLSANISDYDQFVNTAAHASGSIVASLSSMQWLAIASTSTTDAFTHIGGAFTVPVYRLDGLRVAANAAGLWSASLQNPIVVDETGANTVGLVWTGTNYDGSPYPGFHLGLGSGAAGGSDKVDGCWIVCQAETGSVPHSVYAISATDLIFGASPVSVPEPGELATWMLGTSAAAVIARKKRPSR
ncbi:hypothetical protein F183_A12570 [Bryobacterales bacterium F-183]|nr:hypothetical protein F183_A12570 [Bryobacterales bacterium F-183]